jgi:hypothetical protein
MPSRKKTQGVARLNQLQKDIKTILLKLDKCQNGLLEYEYQAYKRLKRYSEMDLTYDGGLGL